MNDESRLLGVSVRGWIALMLVATVCIISSCGNTITEPLYSLAIAAVSFYLGGKTNGGKNV